MTLCLVLSLSPCPLPLALSCLRASYIPPPSGSWDVRAVAMIAWLVSSPACFPVVDLPVSASRRYRLVWRRGERAVLALCSVVAICPVFVSLPRRLTPLAACFDELPIVPHPICFLSLVVSSCVSFLSSRRASRCACLASDVFFLCFLSRSLGHRDCLICPPRSSRPSSRRPVSSGVSGGGVLSCAACLIGSR